MIKVSAEVKQGIDWINSQGEFNPFATPEIATILQACGHKEAGQWVENNPEKYERGLDEGFIVEETWPYWYDTSPIEKWL